MNAYTQIYKDIKADRMEIGFASGKRNNIISMTKLPKQRTSHFQFTVVAFQLQIHLDNSTLYSYQFSSPNTETALVKITNVLLCAGTVNCLFLSF